ncbi:unnamed protein product [Thelazia callipaeda]|uniref:Kelch domain-containing protein 10 n=1 Tax=Thelazia callipaeda TaxID=103827 RepID=A0A0N5DAR0_THECL|nr:unnamed protein product [Thelazia callipaeda]
MSLDIVKIFYRTTTIFTVVTFLTAGINAAVATDRRIGIYFHDFVVIIESSITQDFLVYKFYEKTWYTFNTRGGLPPGRVGHVACVINDKMYVFGGFNESGTYLPMIVIDLISYEWYRPFVRGTIPYGRKYHCIWVHKDKMYITGGYDVMSSKYFNNIYVYDPEKFIWAEMHTSGFEGPLQRRVHSTVIVGTHVYVLYGTMSYQPYGPLNQYTPEKQCGLHVLSLECNLKELAAVAVVRHNLHNLVPNVLPHELKSYLALITEPNSEF